MWNWPLTNWLESEVPVGNHQGSFGFKRKFHTHEGVDLYAPEGSIVKAVESGVVVAILSFTGSKAGSPWWFDTKCVMIEGLSGVVNYGEIEPDAMINVNSKVMAGDVVGSIKRVLRTVKSNPPAMLHLELYKSGVREPVEWPTNARQPENLLDPTKLLISACKNEK